MGNVVQIIPDESAEVRELEADARDWEKQFNTLTTRIEARGFKVFYDSKGEPDVIPVSPNDNVA